MLHTEIEGSGPDLVLVHGWGMHGGIWEDWAGQLANSYRVHRVDLPGHGNSGAVAGDRLDDWTAALADVVPDGAWLLGWSLGGLLTLNFARRYPGRVRGLVQVASTPRFVTADDWPHGVDAAVFEQFATQLAADIDRTLARFLALQVRGAEQGSDTLRQLRTRLAQRPGPRPPALEAGLRLLQDSDLRAVPAELDLPLHWLFGERDTLVPPGVAGQVPGLHAVVEGAGHAPFLSHPQACAAVISGWLAAAGAEDGHVPR